MSDANYDYRYYIDGRKILILQRQTEQVYNPYLEISDDIYVTPTVSDSSAIYLRYTIKSISTPTSENTDLGLPYALNHAIIHYVRSRLAEEAGDMRMSRFHYNQFLRYTHRERRRRTGSVSQVVARHTGAIK